MAQTLPEKLRIRPGDCLLTLHAPAGFKKGLGQLPAGVKISDTATEFAQVHWFVTNKTQLEKELTRVMKMLKPGRMVWVYYPKGSSGIQTDLTRDKGWDYLLKEGDKLAWINLISFNETWSVFGFRAKTDADKKKAGKPKEKREIFNWINAETKEVRIPDELKAAFRKNKKLGDYFESLAFSHKKEYVEWIVTAKKDETRKARVEGTMERLAKKWKNPRNQ